MVTRSFVVQKMKESSEQNVFTTKEKQKPGKGSMIRWKLVSIYSKWEEGPAVIAKKIFGQCAVKLSENIVAFIGGNSISVALRLQVNFQKASAELYDACHILRHSRGYEKTKTPVKDQVGFER